MAQSAVQQCTLCHRVILELRWDGSAEMPLSLSWKPELTLRKGRERKRLGLAFTPAQVFVHQSPPAWPDSPQ